MHAERFRRRAYRGSGRIVPSTAEVDYEWVDAMQFSKRLSYIAMRASPQGPNEISRNVVTLHPEGMRASARVEPGVIKVLEDFLDQARRGNIVAGAIVLVRANGTNCTAISAAHGGSHHLVAACNYLKQHIIAETDN
jgi:hypothetical protein